MSLMRDYINIVEAKNRPSKLVLEKLPYKTSDLAPVLSKENVEYHYNVLSNGYVDRYNNKEGDPDFNYGGAMLHNIFWQQLQTPRGANRPTGASKDFIEEHHKSMDGLLEEMVKKGMSIQGSGWVYIAKNGEIKTTPNQSYKTDILMPVDMWEHSFLDYIPAKDAKKKYLTAIMKIINWSIINDRLNNKS
jgi:Fe-Mn family superoxide dismutase